MTYRKFKADDLFVGGRMADADSVLVTADDGTVQAVIPAAVAGEDVVYHPGLLCPGLINCHCHLELSHMKGVIPEGTGLVDFLSGVIRRRGEAADGVMEAIAAGEGEMLENGIVAVGDICNTADTLEQKRKGRLRYQNFVEAIGFVEAGAKMRFEQGLGVLGQFEEVWPGGSSLVPHAPYSVSPALFRMIAGHAGERAAGAAHAGGWAAGRQMGSRVLSIHSQEDEEENVFLLSGRGDLLRLYAALGLDVSFFRGTGKRSLESWLPYFHREQTMILVHNVATREEDLRAVTRLPESPELHFCLCPNANRYISGRLPDVELLVRNDCRIVVGTDSLASNHGLSILEELKTLQQAFPWLDIATLLQWATLNGARALKVEDMMGSFAPGRKPGVVLLRGLEQGRLAAGTTVQRLL